MIKNKIKFFNICVWICAICYLFAFFSTYFRVNGEYERFEAIYAEMLKESNDFKDKHDYDNAGNAGVQKETPIFTDATTAIDSTYNNFMNTNLSEYSAKGSLVIQASGMTFNVKIQQLQIIYSTGSKLCENRIWLENDKFGITNATQRVYKDGKIYKRDANKDKITYNEETGEISADYENQEFAYEIDEEYFTFIITKDTITRELYFKTNYNPYSGKIESYSASASLHAKDAVKGYDKRLQREGDLLSVPNFTKLEVHCVINRDGTLRSATINESYTSSKSVPVIGMVGYNSSDKISLSIVFLGSGEPSLAEPVINNK